MTRTSELKALKWEFEKLTLKLQYMRNTTETLSNKLLESEKKRIKAENEISSSKKDQRKVKEMFEEPVQRSEDHLKNDEEKLDEQLKDTDSNVELQEAKFDAKEIMLQPQVKNVDPQIDVAPEIKASFVNQEVLAEPENIDVKNLAMREELESASSNEKREALSENMGQALSGVVAGDLDRRYVNSGLEMDANNTDNDFHGVNDSVVIG